ncbi:YtxH domain-containing protein [Flavihumibacter sp. UBA7668]|uniref:YtxH domain-containing protein n=1 Tax=Flavihumibacter sp. UBA7668 TaxID=1946542 RepID=UPI0025C0F8DB|nr:YtxH domain-containing protein [Flavihumibacter sp. UBA7668]
MTTTSKIVLGVLGAAAAGVAIGLLVAPEKGKDLRNKIADNAKNWADEFGTWLSDKKSEATMAAKKMASKAEDIADEAGQEYNRAKRSMS